MTQGSDLRPSGRIKAVHQHGDIIFPGIRMGKPLSNGSMLRVLNRMSCARLTVHGFRATFKTWASEITNFPREVVEGALAHAISDKLEAAYRRGDLFEKRKRLMNAWADFCNKAALMDNIIPLSRTR